MYFLRCYGFHIIFSQLISLILMVAVIYGSGFGKLASISQFC